MNARLISIFVFAVALVIAVSLAIQVGKGEFKTVYITTVLLFSVPILLALGLRSWYTLPFAMLAELPALPLIGGRALSLSELCVTMFSGLMILAIIQGRKQFQLKIKDWWPMFIYGGWVLMIAVINGGGFAILGSSAIGGRRYLTVAIALVGMVALSQMVIREKEAKRVCWLIFASLGISGVYIAVSTLLGRGGGAVAYEFYSWQQGLSYISLGGIFMLFSRYAPSRVVRTPWMLFAFVLLLAIAAYSGKRMNFAACCVIPVIACYWHRQAIFAFAAAMLGCIAISGAILIQNQVTSIPQSLQRVLAFVPADWDWEVEQSTDNIFRDTLSRWAVKSVEENPIIGKGVTMTMDDYRLMNDKAFVNEIKHPDDDIQAFPHIAGKNWHSTWLGLSASFGIPCAIAWIVVQIFVLWRSWRLGHTLDLSTWQRTLVGYIFFFMVYGVMRSISSGDVAVLAMGGGLYLGLMSALKNGIELDQFHQARLEETDLEGMAKT